MIRFRIKIHLFKYAGTVRYGTVTYVFFLVRSSRCSPFRMTSGWQRHQWFSSLVTTNVLLPKSTRLKRPRVRHDGQCPKHHSAFDSPHPPFGDVLLCCRCQGVNIHQLGTVLRIRIRDPVPFWPLDPGSDVGKNQDRELRNNPWVKNTVLKHTKRRTATQCTRSLPLSKKNDKARWWTKRHFPQLESFPTP